VIGEYDLLTIQDNERRFFSNLGILDDTTIIESDIENRKERNPKIFHRQT